MRIEGALVAGLMLIAALFTFDAPVSTEEQETDTEDINLGYNDDDDGSGSGSGGGGRGSRSGAEFGKGGTKRPERATVIGSAAAGKDAFGFELISIKSKRENEREITKTDAGAGVGASSDDTTRPVRRLSSATRFVKTDAAVPLRKIVMTPCNRGLMAYFFFGAFGYVQHTTLNKQTNPISILLKREPWWWCHGSNLPQLC